MTYKLIIFDMDGTLLDTSEGIFNSIKFVQSELNLRKLTIKELEYHLGPPIREAYVHNFNLTGDMLEKAIHLHKKYGYEYGYLQSEVYPGIDQVLNYLRNKNIQIAVASMKPDVILKKIIKLHKFNFDSIHGQLNNESKSSLIEQCMNEVNVCNSDTIMIGDSMSDLNAANECNVDFIGVSYGYGFKKDNKYVDTVDDLLLKLKSII